MVKSIIIITLIPRLSWIGLWEPHQAGSSVFWQVTPLTLISQMTF